MVTSDSTSVPNDENKEPQRRQGPLASLMQLLNLKNSPISAWLEQMTKGMADGDARLRTVRLGLFAILFGIVILSREASMQSVRSKPKEASRRNRHSDRSA